MQVTSDCLVRAKQAKEVANSNLNLAKKLFKENNYYDWVVVILFYSACALITAICNIEDVPVPREHKGRWDKQQKIYIEGMLDKARRYLSKKPYESYSALLVYSQLLRYEPKIILDFQNDPNTPTTIKKIFSSFKLIINDFNIKYSKYL